MSNAERSSLDLGCNNSIGPETVENEGLDQSTLDQYAETGETGETGRYDCRAVYSNFRHETPEGETAPFRCGSWECYCCGYRMRQNLVEEIGRVTSERPSLSRLLTLTLDPALAPSTQEEQHYHITERWNALRTAITQEIGDFSFIWVREEQENGLPHLHILVSRYLPQKWLSNKWEELGGGKIVDIQEIVNLDRAANYVGKYLTKDALSGLPDGIRRYGSSQDISLDVRGSSGDSEPSEWSLLMDDHAVEPVGGEGPLTRPVAAVDFVEQRENGGPVGLDPPD